MNFYITNFHKLMAVIIVPYLYSAIVHISTTAIQSKQ